MTLISRVRHQARRRARGVALVEMLVAVAIVVLIGTMVVVGFGGSDRARLNADAAEVARLLSQARMQALESGRDQPVLLQDGVLHVGAAAHTLGTGTEITPEALSVRVSPTGTSSGAVLRLSRGGLTRVVTLDWLTARVDIE